ncbi:MAG TPA: pyridoxal-dependent decarboxylase [Woeseiaceae bacterium]|nr:pyridoxal-dependent decarboxylase [Woeseiaceae bacterium]
MSIAEDDDIEFKPSLLDPADWNDFRRHAHELLDSCIDQMSSAREHPWRPLDDGVAGRYRLAPDEPGVGYGELASILAQDVLPYATGNTHPRFFGWVHGTGLAAGLMAEIVAATMNSNCGGRDHGAIYLERSVIAWCAQVFGFPAGSSGLLVTGTSQATVIALAVARQRALGPELRVDGLRNAPQLTAYTAEGAHSATTKAMQLLGLGSSAVRRIPANATGGMDLARLADAVNLDRSTGAKPFCVIGTAGSVDLGEFDDLRGLADFCQRESLWLHIDGAFGAWARLAKEPWRSLTNGIERADSLAFDFHKWMYVQYDCGAVLIRDESEHRAAFEARPTYLTAQSQGLGGGDPWFCDYGIDLSRGFRALKVWSAIRACGTAAFSAAITRNCELALQMSHCVLSSKDLSLAAPVRMNVCCFSAAPASMDDASSDKLNASITQQLQLSGQAVFSTTRVAGRTVIRAAITNHRTAARDIRIAIGAVNEMRKALLAAKH